MKSGIAFCGLILAAAVALLATQVQANNIRVSNVRMRNQDVAGKALNVVFDLSWENSWRTDHPSCTNWDAAWVFVKFRPPGSNAWEHARLSVVAGDHNAPGGTISVGSDGTNGMGVFVYSSAVRSGDVSYASTQLRWNYGSNGYAFAKGDIVEVSVQAMEMVYVPAGSFYVGSGGTEPGSFTDGSWVSGATIPFLITGTWDRQITNAAGKLWGTSTTGNSTIGGAGTLNANFPSGFNAFYCMKYEITQGQYRDFLNLLTRAQQATRATVGADYFALTATTAISQRNGIRCPSIIPVAPAPVVFGCDGNANRILNETDDGMDWACSYTSLEDGCAYADWAGLRPMTELEFEKACRGPATPVPNEYAWGTATAIQQSSHTNGTDGSGTEMALPTNANYNTPGSIIPGPVRVGIYATTNSTRASSGASYWGIMELSGNMSERSVTVGEVTVGRLFTGVHGDGALTAAGAANVPNWPVTTGFGFRGSRYWASGIYSKISDRFYAIDSASTRIQSVSWGRCVRTAP